MMFLRRQEKIRLYCSNTIFLEVFHIWTEDIITEKDVVELLQYIESYLFRRIICDLPTNALNKIFIVLDRDITALDGSKQQYVEKLKYILENKKERTQFPTDTMFLECLTVKNIYAMSNKSKQYILERLENGNHFRK